MSKNDGGRVTPIPAYYEEVIGGITIRQFYKASILTDMQILSYPTVNDCNIAAENYVDFYHGSMRGYRQDKHDRMDADMLMARQALAASAEPESN
jgi:hypothetical protein